MAKAVPISFGIIFTNPAKYSSILSNFRLSKGY